MFEKASRLKLRFTSPVGPLSVEDLWDLPLTSKTGKANLDDLAKFLHKRVSESEVSFVERPAESNTVAKLQFDIVKHVIDTKLAERDAAKAAAEKRATKQRIIDLIAEKKDEALKGKSLEELQGMLDGL